jgi:hypothetical protein
LVVVCVLAAMAFLQMFLPNIMQMSRWYAKLIETDRHLLDWELLQDTLFYFALGMPSVVRGGVAGEGIPSVTSAVASHPLLFWLLAGFLVLVLGLGVGALRRRPGLMVILAAVAGGVLVHLGVGKLTELFL